MGKPDKSHFLSHCAEHIGVYGTTWGTETSKYPKEQKSNEIPLVVASERGSGPNHNLLLLLWGCRVTNCVVRNRFRSGMAWESQRDRVKAPYANLIRLPCDT